MSAHHTPTDHDLDHWVRGAGFALAALAVPPATIGIALLASGFVSWWAARQKPFA
jgi:hypothetical protein